MSVDAPRFRADFACRSLYLCTPDRADLREFLDGCIVGGVDVVQLRDKRLDGRALIATARQVKQVCDHHGVPFILNDRPDLALEVGADGVHVGQDDASPALCRRILGPDAIVGLSTHRAEEWEAAAFEPVDYLAVGPVHHTATHPTREPTGFRYVRFAAASKESRPWFVTGGASPSTVGDLVTAGARRFVAVRWLTEASDARAAARALRRSIDAALEAVSNTPGT